MFFSRSLMYVVMINRPRNAADAATTTETTSLRKKSAPKDPPFVSAPWRSSDVWYTQRRIPWLVDKIHSKATERFPRFHFPTNTANLESGIACRRGRTLFQRCLWGRRHCCRRIYCHPSPDTNVWPSFIASTVTWIGPGKSSNVQLFLAGQHAHL
jgi:hypothetical protein